MFIRAGKYDPNHMKNVIPLGGFMKESLYLHIPAYEELWYRQKIIQDPDTMSYNKGYDLNFNDYDKETGCIDFPKRSGQIGTPISLDKNLIAFMLT